MCVCEHVLILLGKKKEGEEVKKRRRRRRRTQPPTVACKNGSSVGMRARRVHVLARFGADFAMPSRCLPTKFLGRSSVGSLSRRSCVAGWGNASCSKRMQQGGEEEEKKKKEKKRMFVVMRAIIFRPRCRI